jgi:hypothetical protein
MFAFETIVAIEFRNIIDRSFDASSVEPLKTAHTLNHM